MNKLNIKARAITGFTRKQLTQLFRDEFQGGAQAADYFFKRLYQKGEFDPLGFPFFSFAPQTLKSLKEKLYLPELLIEKKQQQGNVSKFLWKTEDSYTCEAVYLEMKGHGTLCVSSQLGCSMGCLFCETGRLELKRSLKAHEIIGQYMAVCFQLGLKAENLVFMGMGEPLICFDELVTALEIFMDPRGPALLPGNITLSSCGYVPGIEKLTRLCAESNKQDFRRLHLAVSLHAGNDELRSKLMPVNRAYPLSVLKKALLEFNHPWVKDRLYLEYVIMPGINDSSKDAFEVANFARELKTTINLIGYNPGTHSVCERPNKEQMGRFFDLLWSHGQACRMRDSKGCEIMAGCGQLAYHQ